MGTIISGRVARETKDQNEMKELACEYLDDLQSRQGRGSAQGACDVLQGYQATRREEKGLDSHGDNLGFYAVCAGKPP